MKSARWKLALVGLGSAGRRVAGRFDYNSFGLDRPFILGSFRLATLIDGRSISDSTFDSIRGRTLFVSVKRTW